MAQLYRYTYAKQLDPFFAIGVGIETVLKIQHERPGQFEPAGLHHCVDALYGGALEPDSQLILLVEAAVIDICIAINFQNDRVLLERIADSRRTAGQQSRMILVNAVVNLRISRERCGKRRGLGSCSAKTVFVGNTVLVSRGS
jgi:hypothetical protein